MADYPSLTLTASAPAELARWDVQARTVQFAKVLLDGAAAKITYFMRAERNPAPGYVVWTSIGAVDSDGLRAPTPIIPGTITIQASI